MTLDSVPISVLLAVLIAATVNDMRYHRLPNILTASAALLGIILQCWLHGWDGLLNGLAGFFTGMLLLIPFYAVHWMGAGDVKLMAAVGTFLGWPDSLLAVALTSGIGSIAALGYMAAQGELTDYGRRYGLMAKCLFCTGKVAYVPPTPGESSTLLFPYALAIALGTLATLVSAGRLGPFVEILGGFIHA
ncbi:MAG: A24 family peptidase [Methylobacter sp.]